MGGRSWHRRIWSWRGCCCAAGKPVFLAVNKMDSEEMEAGAENFRRLGFRNVIPISAEHGIGIGDLLDEVFAVLPEPAEVAEEPTVMLEGIEKRPRRMRDRTIHCRG